MRIPMDQVEYELAWRDRVIDELIDAKNEAEKEAAINRHLAELQAGNDILQHECKWVREDRGIPRA
jgi:hypothetical protein